MGAENSGEAPRQILFLKHGKPGASLKNLQKLAGSIKLTNELPEDAKYFLGSPQKS